MVVIAGIVHLHFLLVKQDALLQLRKPIILRTMHGLINHTLVKYSPFFVATNKIVTWSRK